MLQNALAWVGLAVVLLLAADMLLLTLQHKGWAVRRPWAHWGWDHAERRREQRRAAARRLHERRQAIPRAMGAAEPESPRALRLVPLAGRHNQA